MATQKGRRQPKATAAGTAKAPVAAIDPAEILDDRTHPAYKRLQDIAFNLKVTELSAALDEISPLCIQLFNERSYDMLHDAAQQLFSAKHVSTVLGVMQHHLNILIRSPQWMAEKYHRLRAGLSVEEHLPGNINNAVNGAGTELRHRAMKVLQWLLLHPALLWEVKHLGVAATELAQAVTGQDQESRDLVLKTYGHIGVATDAPAFVDGPVQARHGHRAKRKEGRQPARLTDFWQGNTGTMPKTKLHEQLVKQGVAERTAYLWLKGCSAGRDGNVELVDRDKVKAVLSKRKMLLG